MTNYKLNLCVTTDDEEMVRTILETDSLAALILAGTTCLKTLAPDEEDATDDTPDCPAEERTR